MIIGWRYGRGWNGCHSNCKHLHRKLIPTILSRIDKKSIIVSMLFLPMFWGSRGGSKQFQSSHDSLIHLFIGPWRSFFLSVWWSFCLENQDTLEQTLWPVTAVVGGYKIIRHNSNGHADLFSFKLFLKQNCLFAIWSDSKSSLSKELYVCTQCNIRCQSYCFNFEKGIF